MFNIEQVGMPAFLVKVLGPESFVYIQANRALERQTGLHVELFDGRAPAEVLSEQMARIVLYHYEECVRTAAVHEYEEELEILGKMSWWRTTLMPILDQDSLTVDTLLGVTTDVTEKNRAKAELEVANTRLSLALQALKGAHWHYDIAEDGFHASPSLAMLLGEPEPRGLSLGEWMERVHPEDQDEASLHRLIDGSMDQQLAHFRVKLETGQPRWLRCQRMVVYAKDQHVSSIYGVTVDVTDEMLKQQELSREAHQDSLTTLLNRRGFFRQLESLVARSEQDGEPLAVMMLDLDRFKEINDAFGHAAGDAVLIEVASRIESATRPCDSCARLGGDEFIIAVRGIENAATEVLAARIRQQIEGAPLRFCGQTIPIRASIGQANWATGLDVLRLTELADQALYAEKRRLKATAGYLSHQSAAIGRRLMVNIRPTSMIRRRP